MKKTLNHIFDEANASEIDNLVKQNAAPEVSADTLSSIKDKVYAKTNLKKGKKTTKSVWLRFGAIAACFLLIVSAIIVVPMLHNLVDDNPDVGVQQPDRLLIEIINGYEYVRLGSPEPYYLEKYPKLKDVATKIVTGYEYHLTEECLGDYIGVVPAYKIENLPEGKAYHWSEYPNYDTIIIVERNGKYSFYVSDGNNLSDDIAKDSSSVMQMHDMPNSVLTIVGGDTEILISDKTIIAEICTVFSGKEKDTKHAYRDLIWQDWLAEKGEVGVHFDGKTFTYDNADVNNEFAAFYGANIKTFYFKLKNDFEIIMRFDSKYNYFMLCNNYYPLSDTETETLMELLGIK